MTVINVADLTKIDLNLLVVFHVLMEERHVTRAAGRLRLSQGAVSAALGRLRNALDDSLFIRTRQGMEPTSKALSVAPAIGRALAGITTEFFGPEQFDPTTSTATFHLAMSDDIEMVLLPYLLNLKAKCNWQVNFSIHQTNSALWQEHLEDHRINALLTSAPAHVPAKFQERTLFTASYSLLYSSKQLGIEEMGLEAFLRTEHLRISYNTQRGFLDELLEARGQVRQVVGSVSHFAGAIPLILARPLVAIVPDYTARLIAETTGLNVQEPPIEVPRFTISYLWRGAEETQSESVWLRSILAHFDPTSASP